MMMETPIRVLFLLVLSFDVNYIQNVCEKFHNQVLVSSLALVFGFQSIHETRDYLQITCALEPSHNE